MSAKWLYDSLCEDKESLNDETVVLMCECGCDGCWDLLMTIDKTDDTVSWVNFNNPHRSKKSKSGYWDYSGFKFCFDKQQYADALDELKTIVDKEKEEERLSERANAMKRYLYVTVIFIRGDRTMLHYICNDDTVKEGDTVLVDLKGEKKEAVVMSRQYYEEDSVPYPLDKNKTVIEITHCKPPFDENMIEGVKLDKYKKLTYLPNEQREAQDAWVSSVSKEADTAVISFENCWVKPKLEMRFEEVEVLKYTGENTYQMFECTLIMEDNRIFFAPGYVALKHIEKSASVVAKRLSWRFVDKAVG